MAAPVLIKPARGCHLAIGFQLTRLIKFPIQNLDQSEPERQSRLPRRPSSLLDPSSPALEPERSQIVVFRF
jgi:hypothetical protein